MPKWGAPAAEVAGSGSGQKREIGRRMSTSAKMDEFVTFGPNGDAKTTVFYTTFRHGDIR